MQIRLYARLLVSLTLLALLNSSVDGTKLLLGRDMSLAWAEPANQSGADDTDRELLEKSLSIVEINRELQRTQSRRAVVQQQMDSNRSQLKEEELRLQSRKKKAGDALADYYMGKQERLLGALLHAKSLAELLRALDYMDVMARSDRRAIDEYRSRAQQLRNGYAELEKRKSELNELERTLLARRQRQQTLQRQLEDGIDGSSNPDELRGQIGELQQLWEAEGRDKLRTYFRALAKAMNKLPDWLQDNPDYLKLDKSGYTLKLPDKALNQFIQEQDPSLNSFSFRFENGEVIASGSEGNLRLEASGRYEVVEEPKNGIRFRISELSFNGLKLPQETVDELEKSFNLGFYPGKFVSFLRIDSVAIEESSLVLRFKFSF